MPEGGRGFSLPVSFLSGETNVFGDDLKPSIEKNNEYLTWFMNSYVPQLVDGVWDLDYPIDSDLVSSNWDGTSPPDLTVEDTGATAGWALDTSVGSMQLEGSLFVGGDISLSGSSTLSSTNFVSGSTGFQIEGDGDAEFNDVIIRGGTWGLPQGTAFPGSPENGQLFYRTDLNIAYRYSGSAWIDVDYISSATRIADGIITTAKIGTAQITTALIGDLQVTAGKIANATITNAQIASLDADKITAGTLAAGRIAANSLTVDKISGGTYSNGDITFSGTADLLSSDFVTGSAGWRIRGNGDAEFNDVVVRGDFESANWNGASPANLASMDATATAGFYLDSSAGAAQFEGDVFIGDDLYVDGGRLIVDYVGAAGSLILDGDVGGSGYLGLSWKSASAGGGSFKALLWQESSNSNLQVEAGANLNLWGGTGVNIGFNGDYPIVVDTFQGDSSNSQAKFLDGSQTVPSISFQDDTNVGLYRPGDNQLAFTTGGTRAFYIDSSQNINFDSHIIYNADSIRAASATSAKISFTDDTNTGMGNPAADQVALYCGGVVEFTIGSTGIDIPNVYDDSTAGTANVLVESDGGLHRATSLEETKEDIASWTVDGSVFDLKPITFYATKGNVAKGEERKRASSRRLLGLGARHTESVSPTFATHDLRGEVEGIDWNAIVTALIGEVKALKEEVAELKVQLVNTVSPNI